MDKFESAWATYSKVEAYHLDRAEIGIRFPEDFKADGHLLWVAEQQNDPSVAEAIEAKYRNFFNKG